MANEILKLIFKGQDDTDKAIKSLRGNLDKADKAIGKVKSSLGGMTGAIGLAAGAAGLGAMAKNALQAADELGKFADRTGIAASELASMQLASNYAGVSTETFNKILVIFQKRLGEAVNGTGTAKRTLDAFGISAEKLSELPLDQQLGIIADEFQKIENPAERAAAASDLFSNRGIKMINFLMMGSEGLESLRSEFRNLGLEIKDETLDEIEAFNDATTKLSAIINTAMIKGLAAVAPEMQKFAERASEMAVPLVGDLFEGLNYIVENMDDIVTGIKFFIGAMVVAKVVAFASAVTTLVSALGGMSVVLAAITGPVGLVIAGIAALSAVYITFKDEIDKAVKSLSIFKAASAAVGKVVEIATGIFGDNADQIEENTKTNKEATNQTDDLEASIDDLRITVTATRRPIETFEKSVEETAKTEQKAAVETDEFREAIEKLRKLTQSVEDDFVDVTEEIANYKKALEAGRITQEQYEEALRKLIGGITDVDDELGDLTEQIETNEEALRVLIDEFGEADSQVIATRQKIKELREEFAEKASTLSTLTKEQQKYIDKVAETDKGLAELKAQLLGVGNAFEAGTISAEEYADAVASINSQIADLDTTGLGGLANLGAFFETENISEFFQAIADGSSAGGALGQMIDKLIGPSGVQQAIAGCFGVQPVLDFDKALRDLFTGDGSALGAFSVALGGLGSALSQFFAEGEFKFSAFKDAIIKVLADIAAAAVASVGINFLKNLIPGLNTGGEVQGYATGGRVRGKGGPKEDKVLARLSPGEYVINAATVSQYGTGFFDDLNGGKLPKFNAGGAIGDVLAMGLPELGSSLGVVPGLQMVAVVLSAIEFITSLLSNGGTSQFATANAKLAAVKDQYIGKNVIDAMTGLGNVFGAEIAKSLLIPTYGLDENGAPIVTGESIGGIINAILTSGTPLPGGNSASGVKQNQEIIEGMSGLSGELAEFLYEYMGSRMLKIAIPDFNMDDAVAKLFNSAQEIAGGSLTLAAREFGGPLERGQASVVGEGGPELFVPGRGGTVSPISPDGGKELIQAVRDVQAEVATLRRQVARSQGAQLAGGRA